MFCQKCGTQNPDAGRFCRSCGNAINVAALPVTEDFAIDHKGKKRTANPNDIWASAIRNMLSGLGFFIMSMILLTTDIARGQKWWWAMLFPAFSLLATGVSQYAKVRRIEKQRGVYHSGQQTQVQPAPQNTALPPTQQDYIAPQAPQRSGSIYDTGEFEVRPPSVTEGTTRHLEINKEGETINLPRK